MTLELVQFRHSPYNEKVRWALDLKRVPHVRRRVLPGPHVPAVKKLTGRTGTPVLVSDGQAMDGSARLLEWLEARYPSPPLFPADPAQRSEALRIQAWFDDDLTPRIRRLVLDTLLREPDYFARVFGDGAPRLQQVLYAMIVPLAAPLVRKGNGITGDASVADGTAALEEALAFAAERSAATGYMVGDAFSLADVTVASTLATVARPPDSPMAAPRPVAPRYRALVERFASHPGTQWTHRIYAKHRGALADFDGASPGAGA